LIPLHSFYGTTAAGTRPWKTRLSFGNQLIALYQGTTLEVAEKPEFFEGDGLQAVHNCFAVNAALAAEGAILVNRDFFRSLFSRATPRPKGQGFSPCHRKIRTNFQWKKRRG
jgi:hypothetical protein